MLIQVQSLLTLVSLGQPPAAALDPAEAARVIALSRTIAAEDRGRLWGRSIAGPILIVERSTGLTYGSEPDEDGRLTPVGEVFRGRLPSTINPANTAVTYAGKRWSMVVWPIPSVMADRRQLLAHELWHRIQDSLGLPANSPSNGHLDREAGRVSLRLEARALARALALSGKDVAESVVHALSFRAARSESNPSADSTETMLERNEGLAEYTGLRLSGRSPLVQRAVAAAALARLENAETVGRSFAYATGPAYGLLLDDLRPGWRLELKSGAGLAALARRATGIRLVSGEDLARAELQYEGAAVRVEEADREVKRAARRRELVGLLVDGPVLWLPLAKAQVGFDPGAVESLDSLGTVYGALRLTDGWGVLDATRGRGLVAADWQSARVAVGPRFDPTKPAGPGWELTLAPGWAIISDSIPGRWRVVRSR